MMCSDGEYFKIHACKNSPQNSKIVFSIHSEYFERYFQYYHYYYCDGVTFFMDTRYGLSFFSYLLNFLLVVYVSSAAS